MASAAGTLERWRSCDGPGKAGGHTGPPLREGCISEGYVMEQLPTRKIVRLQNYDYSRNGAYFITICTQNRTPYFGMNVGADPRVRPNCAPSSSVGADRCVRPQSTPSPNVGADRCVRPQSIPSPNVGADRCVRPKTGAEIAEYWLYEIPHHFEYVSIDKSVIMPDHIHFVLRIDRPLDTGGHTGPPLPQIVQWYKTMTTAEYSRLVKSGILPPYNNRLWQRGFYDHVIRNEHDYIECMKYIEQNPLKKLLFEKKEQ